MKTYIGIMLLLFVVACGQTENPDDTASSEPKETDPYAEYERISEGCEELSLSGQTFEDISEEEKALYEVREPLESESLEYVQIAQMQTARNEYINKRLKSYGYPEGLSMVDSVGGMRFLKGTVIIQLKDGLEEEQKARSEAIKKAVQDAKEHYNDQAVVLQQAAKTTDELDEHRDSLTSHLVSMESLKKKVISLGYCNQSGLELVIREDLSEEELQFINDETDIQVGIRKRPPNKKTGYVTGSGDNRVFVSGAYFRYSNKDIEVGDRVTVSYETMMESLPAKSVATDIKIHTPKQPEGADLNEKEVIQQSLNMLESDTGHRSIQQVNYHEQSDEWEVQIQLMSTGEPQNKDITIKDE